MPHLISCPGCKQHHPLYKKKSHGASMSEQKRADQNPEQTTKIAKTYDAIKTAAGAEMKPKGKK